MYAYVYTRGLMGKLREICEDVTGVEPEAWEFDGQRFELVHDLVRQKFDTIVYLELSPAITYGLQSDLLMRHKL